MVELRESALYWKVLKMLKMLKMLKTLNPKLSETPKIIKIRLLDQENHNNELRGFPQLFRTFLRGWSKKYTF